MFKFATPILTAGAIALSSTPALAGREDQWVAREALGDGSRIPTALFLSWNYKVLLFRATCDQGELILDYFGDGEISLSRATPMTIVGATPVKLRTRLVDGHLEGRVKVTEQVLQSLATSAELEIDAPNAMGEPWYVGRAEPLRRLARRCS